MDAKFMLPVFKSCTYEFSCFKNPQMRISFVAAFLTRMDVKLKQGELLLMMN
jgi:hypothetical protein